MVSTAIQRDKFPATDAAFGGQKCGADRPSGHPRTAAHEREKPRRAVILFDVARKEVSKNAGG